METVSEDRADKALHHLINTVDEYAQATADSRYYYYALRETLADLLRETEATEFVQAEGSQELRKAQARASEDYKQIMEKRQETLEKYREAEYKRQKLESSREAARTTLSMYQSLLRHQSQDGM